MTVEKLEVQPLGEVPISMIKIENRYRSDQGEIELMAESMKAHGQIHPVCVNSKMKLLAGERRILAAQLLGWETVRAEMRSNDTVESGLEVELDENQMRKNFTWPEVARLEKAIFVMKAKKDPKWSLRKQEEFRDVSKSLVGMRLELAEALELLPELETFESQADAWKYYKKLEENVTVGQLRSQVPAKTRDAPKWAHDHYIVGNALECMPILEAESADFAEVDPPYGIELDRRKERNIDDLHTDDYNEVDKQHFPTFMKVVINEVYRILKPNTFAVFWYGMQWHCEMYAWLRQAKFAVNPMCAFWYKGQVGQTAQPDVAFGSVYEPFYLARKGQPKFSRPGRANVFHYPSVSPSKKIHTTEKPLDLLSDIINTVLPDRTGANILVPFLGSGVTLRAAYGLGHTGIGFDLSPENKSRFLATLSEDLPASDPEVANLDEDFDEDLD